MLTIINIAQIIFSLLLIGGVLLQQRGGGGLSPVFGGNGSVYRTRRGVEKFIFVATVIIAALFFVSAFLNIYLRK